MTAGEVVLSNVGPGPDRLSLPTLDAEFVVLVLHRDFYCSEDRQQVRLLKRRYEEFETRDVAVVSVLPEDEATTEQWQKQYHLPFPVVADPDTDLGDRFEQGIRFGLLGRLHDVVGRMPAAVVLDVRGDDPVEVFGHRGSSRTDRPGVDDLLAAVDRAAATDVGAARTAVASADSDAPDSSATEASIDAQAPAESATSTGAPAESTDVSDRPLDSPPDIDPSPDPDPSSDIDLPPDLDTSPDPNPSPDPDLPVDIDLPAGVSVRRAGPDDVVPVLRVLNGALLEMESDRVREAVGAGEVVVAADDGFVVGALVRDGSHVEAVAVRRERRKQGLGSALVEAAAVDAADPLSADFRAGLRGFWESLGFVVESREDRLWGWRPRG